MNKKSNSVRGRKLIEITPDMIAQAKTMAAAGCNDKQIYQALGMSHDTFYKKKKNITEFSDAIDQSRAQGIAVIANAHYQAARNGNIKAQQFFLKTRAGFHETQQHQMLDESGERSKWEVKFVNADSNLLTQKKAN